jgi:SAM-dependent methyltransferase
MVFTTVPGDVHVVEPFGGVAPGATHELRRCPVCDSPKRKRLFVTRDWIQLFPYPLGGWRLIGRLAGHVPALHARATHDLGNLLHPWRPGGALLDVGCGAGRYLDLMRRFGWDRVVGVDISETAADNARQLGLEAYAGELSSVCFPERTFDAVSLSHTLEHVADPEALLREIRRIAKPGARVAIVVPNARSLCARLFRPYWVGWEAPRHLVNFSPGALAHAIERAGLELESLTTSAEDSGRMTLFCLSRALGDPNVVYTDDRHSFQLSRRALAALLAAVEWGLCLLGRQVGEKILAVART